MAGLYYGTYSPGFHLMINVIVSLVVFFSFVIASRLIRRHILKKVGYVLSLFIFFGFTGKISDGYLGDALRYMFLLLIFVIIIPIIYFAYKFSAKRI
jgi:hypothetical protein